MAYKFSCRDAGAEGCGWRATAGTEDELIAKVAAHAQKVHRVKNVTQTIANYARSAIKPA